MANRGTGLQILVHAVETAVSGSPNVNVESPKRLRDKDTGQWREHDVVLTFTQAHHEFLLALECRDRSRPVGVPDVEAFHAKCLRTGIGRGLIVSSTGFRKTALAKAESYGIGCLTLQEVTRFNWCLTPAVTVLNHDLLGANVVINFEREPPPGWVAYSADGLPVTPAVVGAWALRFFNEVLMPEGVEGDVTRTFVDVAPALHTVDHDGSRIAATQVSVTCRYQINRVMVPLEFREYLDTAKNNLLTSMATAQMNLQNQPVTLVLTRAPDDGTFKLTLVPNPQQPKT
jgi:restriction endonuclease